MKKLESEFKIEFTENEQLEILNLALNNMQSTNNHLFGLCHYIFAAIRALNYNIEYYYIYGERKDGTSKLTEVFNIPKPKKLYSTNVWFSLNENGFNKRIKLLKNRIKELENGKSKTSN